MPPSGPRNCNNLDVENLKINHVAGAILRPPTTANVLAIIKDAFEQHFDWKKDLRLVIGPSTISRSMHTLCFGFVLEFREAHWQSSNGKTRGFDEIFHSLDIWHVVAPSVILSSTAIEKSVEMEWPSDIDAGGSTVKTLVPCWNHATVCISCRGVQSME